MLQDILLGVQQCHCLCCTCWLGCCLCHLPMLHCCMLDQFRGWYMLYASRCRWPGRLQQRLCHSYPLQETCWHTYQTQHWCCLCLGSPTSQNEQRDLHLKVMPMLSPTRPVFSGLFAYFAWNLLHLLVRSCNLVCISSIAASKTLR